jgi:hypothetical protein
MYLCAAISAFNEKWGYCFMFFAAAIIVTIEFVCLFVSFKIDKCFGQLEKLLNQEKNKEQRDDQKQ